MVSRRVEWRRRGVTGRDPHPTPSPSSEQTLEAPTGTRPASTEERERQNAEQRGDCTRGATPRSGDITHIYTDVQSSPK